MSFQYEAVARPSSGLRLHLNENTAGCSPRVIEALQRLGRLDAALYPNYDDAIAACAARLNVGTERIILTNGLDEGILAVTVAALRDRTVQEPDAIVVVPAFDMYAATADGVGARVVEVALGPEFAFSVENVVAAITPRTRLVFLTSPNNPTGLLIAPEDVAAVARQAPHATIFIDEAYADFAGVTLIDAPEVAGLSNLVIGRTFAKAYGMAGLRAGALVGEAGTLDSVRRVMPPFSVNVYAAAALVAGMADADYYDWYRAQVAQSKALLYAALDRAGVRFWPSEANFVLARFDGRAGDIVRGLAARGIHVRDKSRDPACPGCIRITAGVVEHTEACIRALEEVLCGGV